ncbi:MAG: dihydroorotate dehydrogenase [Clostridiales bacterium]|nr:dihydroorotate dehydrogenase [Clostridiales bacterium]
MANLSVKIAGISMKNPIILASGTCGYGRELAQIYDLSLLGGICVKGTTLHPRPGNPPPRIAETPCGMLNSVGLQNPGVETVIAQELPFLAAYDTAVIVNIAGHDREHYRAVTERLEQAGGFAALELNISCPNVAAGGMAFGTDAAVAADITALVRAATGKPLIVKLSPNVTNIADIARAVEAAGADAVSLINTLQGLVIDLERRRPVLGGITGGLSGPAIKPVALRMVWQVAKAVAIPVIGMGGVASATDALEFMLAGASAVQIGAAAFRDPLLPLQVARDMEEWLNAHGVNDVNELVGELEVIG